MIVAIVSKSDEMGGGASRVAAELNSQLIKGEGDVNSKHYTGLKRPTTTPFYGWLSKLCRTYRNLERSMGFSDLAPIEKLICPSDDHWKASDIYHVHDISSVFSTSFLSRLSMFTPVVWTLHDCSPFTGGCIAPINCERYKSGCGSCPQVGQWPLDGYFDFTSFLLGRKKILHRKSKIFYVSPSQWLADKAYSSGTFPYKPVVISNGIDQSVFKVLDKNRCRYKSQVPDGRLVLVVLASSLLDPNKGIEVISPIFEHLKRLNPYLLLVGTVDNHLSSRLSGLDHVFTGYISDRSILAEVLNSADALLYCVKTDNQPLAVMEAMSCGLPVFGFSVGGIPEMLINGEHGELVEYGEYEKLVDGISEYASTGKMESAGRAAASYALGRYDLSTMASSYHKFYKNILES